MKSIIKLITPKLIVYVLLIGILIGGFFYVRNKIFEAKSVALSATVSAKLVECAELCVTKYEYTEIATVKHKVGIGWFASESHNIVQYDAVVRAGISNMRKIDFTISKDGKKITIKLPSMEILGNDIIKHRFISHSEGLFAPDATTEEILEEIDKSKSKKLDNQMSSMLLDKAKEQVKSVLTDIFSGMRFEEVIIK